MKTDIMMRRKGLRNMKEFLEINNPYTLQFSFIPPRLIDRSGVTSEIVDNFARPLPTYRGMFITGVRGSGKTVMLGAIRKKFEATKDWITVDLNPEDDLLNALARALYIIPELQALFFEARLDFSALGIGFHIENAKLVASNDQDAVKLMLKTLKKSKKKLLVTIDEITYSKDVSRFSHALSSFSNEGYDIYLLMTGLVENIREIKNEKSLTFLYRAKAKELDVLNITAIRNDYQSVLKLSREKAEELAYITRGYSLGFQALGYHYWNALCASNDTVDIDAVCHKLDLTLSELAYEKIWEEFSARDKEILNAMSLCLTARENSWIKVEEIRNKLGISSNVFTKYRSRLLDSGVVDGSNYGHLRFKLPRFEQFVMDRKW